MFGSTFGYNLASITNNGTITLNAPSGLVPYNIPGSIISGSGATLTAGANARVTLTGAAASTVSGTNSFNQLFCTTAGRTVNFGAGTTTTITGTMFFQGVSGNPILIRSSSAGTQAILQVNGSVVAQYVNVQDNAASSTVYATPGGVNSGNNTNWDFGGAVVAVADTGTIQSVWSNDVTGLANGSFTLQNTTASAATLNSLTIQASGTGNDSTAYTEVAVYRDNTSAGTVGSYDSQDIIYDASVAAFPADNGARTFTASLALAAASTTRFFVVVKFNGTPLASPLQIFQTAVSALSVSGANTAGTPTLAMRGHQISQPTLSVASTSVTARPCISTYTGPGGNGFEYARFTITNTSPVPVTANTIRLYGYTGTHMGSVNSVQLFQDSNGSDAFEFGTDTQVGSTFTTWTNYQDFTYSGSAGNFAANEVRTYFIVTKLNGSTTPPAGTQLGYYFSSSSTATGAIFGGTMQTVRYGVQIQTAALAAGATVGTAVQLSATSTTPTQAGKFTITNTSASTSHHVEQYYARLREPATT